MRTLDEIFYAECPLSRTQGEIKGLAALGDKYNMQAISVIAVIAVISVISVDQFHV